MISVVIPVFNEEKRLDKSLENICSYFKHSKFDYEIIVVDDGSVDNTVKLVESRIEELDKNIFLIENRINRGKGFSVKNGFLHAGGQYLLFTDADLSTPIDQLEKLLLPLKAGYHIAIGSRALKESEIRIHQPLYRQLMGKIFNLLVRVLILDGFKDTQCGFKVFTKEAALKIIKRQKIERFSFDVEMLYIARKHGYQIKEVPVRWHDHPVRNIRLMQDGSRMIIDLIRIRLFALQGAYE